MVDDVNPWEGVSIPAEQPRRPKPKIERRDPVAERTLNNAEVLAGTRGEKLDHAVRFRDLEKLRETLQGVIAKTNDMFEGDLSAKIKGQFAAIDAESQALVAELDDAFDNIRSELEDLDQLTADLTVYVDDELADNLAYIQQNYYTQTWVDQTLAALETDIESEFDDTYAHLNQTYYTKSQTHSAISADTATMQTTVNGHTATLTTLGQSVDGIETVWGVENDINGHVTGVGLISKLVEGDPVSDFIIRDSSLRVVNSQGDGDYTPFAVYPTGRTVGGVYIPPGVHAKELWVNNANIANAAIDAAKIRDLSVITAKIADLSVDTLKVAGEAITVPTASTGQVRTGNDTWQIGATGTVNMPDFGRLLVFWSLEQGYAGPSQWAFRIKVNGTIMFERSYMDAINDYPSGTHMFTNGFSGAQNVVFEWKGLDANISSRCYLSLLGRMK